MEYITCCSRRSFLGASLSAVIGSAGCIEPDDASHNTQNFQRRSVVLAEGNGSTLDGIEVTFDVSDGTADEASPAALTVTLSNARNRLVALELPCQSVLSYPLYSNDREYVLVIPSYSFDRRDECWQRTSDDDIGVSLCETSVRLAPGESWSKDLALWATKGGPCMPTGTFDFETRLSFLEVNPTHEFSLRVEEV